MQQRPSRASLLLSIPALVALAACGGGGSSAPPPPGGPTDLDYGAAAVSLARGIPMADLVPTVTGTVDAWSVSAGSLPVGVALDAGTGVISGTPSGIQGATLATISATETGVGSDTFDLTFTVDAASARALFVANEDDGYLTTLRIHPTDGYVNHDDLITGLDSPRDLCLTPDLENLYVVNAGNGTINAYDVDPITADLTELASSPVTMTGGFTLNANSVVSAPSGDFLFVADRAAAGVSRFSIAAGGDLTELAGSPTPGLTTAHDLVSLRRPGGDFLYVLAQGLASPVVAFSIDGSGDLTQVDTEATGPGPTMMAATPEGDRLYVLNLSDSTISGFDVEDDGTLTPLAGSPFNTVAGLTTFPATIAITSDGTNTFLYTSEAPGTVTQSSIGADGAPTLIGSGSVTGAGASYRGMLGAPDAGHLYLVDQGLDELHTWRADGTGALAWHPTMARVRMAGDHVSLALLPSATAPVWGPEAMYLSESSGTVSQLTVDASGSMTPMVPDQIATGTTSTQALEVHPDHDMVYVTNPGDATNTIMSIPIQGDLSLDGLGTGGSAAASSDALDIDLDASGDFMVLLSQGNTVSTYPIGATGLLGTQSATIATGAVPVDVTVGPTGKNVYVTNFFDGDVSLYDLDPATGVLSSKGPAAAGASAIRNIAVHPSGRYAYASATGPAGPTGDLVGQYLLFPGSGTLSLMATPAIGTALTPGPLACTPDGKFLLVGSTDTLEVFAVNTDPGNAVDDGSLSGPVASAAIPASGQSIEISQDGTRVYVASNSAGIVSAFTIDGAGALTPLDSDTLGGELRRVGLRHAIQ